MRVAHIELGRHLYGGARQVLYLIDGLNRRGVESVLLCPTGSAIAAAARGICETVELPLQGDLDVGAARRMRRALTSPAPPDIVHVHSRRGADLYGGLASVGAPWRAVLTRRVDNTEWPLWARLKYRPYSAVIAISRAVERELIEHVGLTSDRVHRVPSGVPPGDFPPRGSAADRLRTVRDLGLPPDALVAAVIGQLIPRKGHLTLLEALPAVLRKHPRWHVVLFGRGPLEARLRRAIRRRGLSGRVHLAGFRSQLAEVLPHLDLVLHPATKEGMGLAVLEAMAAGVPVVASAVGGLLDVIEDGVGGRLVRPGDPHAWAEAIAPLLADPERRTRLGAAGRCRVAEAFTARGMVLGNLAVYRAVQARQSIT